MGVIHISLPGQQWKLRAMQTGLQCRQYWLPVQHFSLQDWKDELSVLQGVAESHNWAAWSMGLREHPLCYK